MCNKFIWLAAFSALAGAVSQPVAAQTEPQAAYQQPLAAKSLLTDIVTVKGNSLVAAGARGHILLSSDGSNWQQAMVPVQANLNSVYFLSKDLGWAVGHDATILHTTDGGNSWSLQQYAPQTDKPLFDIIFFDKQNGIAVGAYGLFYRTTDGGNSWRQEFHAEVLNEDDQSFLSELKETDPEAYEIELGAILPHFNRLYADGNVLYMVGEAGFTAKSTDRGQSWNRLEEFYNGSFFDITRSANMSLVAVGLRGHAFRSKDQGASWSQLVPDASATFNSAFSDENGRLYLVGNGGTLLISKDDGESFADHSQANGKAIVNGLVWQDKLVLVTETGVTTIMLSELE